MIKLSVTTAGQVTRRRAPSPSGAPVGAATWRCSASGVSGQPGPPPSRKHCGARAEQAALDLACRAPSSAHGEAPGQLDSQAKQSRVSPSCPEWPARSQSRMPPQSELPSWAGNVCPPLVTSGCLDASPPTISDRGDCLSLEVVAAVGHLASAGEAGSWHRVSSEALKGQTLSPGSEQCVYNGGSAGAGGGRAEEPLQGGPNTVNFHGCSVFSGSWTSAS